MIHLIKRFLRKKALIASLLSAALIFSGCASNKADVEKVDDAEVSVAPTLITNLITAEDSELATVTVRGNRFLTYTSIKQDIPLGILFYFHETGLDETIQSTYTPESDLISSIETSELADQEGTTRILISLKKDTPYDVTPDDTGIKISFSKTSEAQASSDSAAASETAELVQATKPVDAIVPAASILKSVYVLKYEEKIKINVNADGVIKNYKSFTIKSPARIVFDIYNIKSPFKKQKTVPANSKWVSRVRHFGYPDKVRVVLDTKKKFLSSFSAYPVETGLEIHVGKDEIAPVLASSKKVITSEKAITPEKKAPVPEEKPIVVAEKMKPAYAYTKPAWVNRIDFLGKETGKSTVIIGTTHPVNHELVEVTDRLLRINLFNTKLPKYRKRPLITTRFESAVDRITPFFKTTVKNTSMVAIELRERVPYTLEQKEDLLLIHFEASSIPPKPFEQADLPSWKKVFAQMDIKDSVAEKMPIAKTPDMSQEKEYEKVERDKPGVVLFDKSDQDLYDLKRQRRIEAHSGKPRIVEAYYGETAKKYTGEKIALDFYDTDIKNVFRILKEISGQNFAIDKDVTGKITLSFDKPVPWDQVLDLVLKMNKLGRIYEGDIIRIATLETLKEEEVERKEKLKAKQEAKKQEDLITAFLPISYTSASELAIAHLIKKGTEKIISKGTKSRFRGFENTAVTGISIFNPDRGVVSTDARLNMVILTDVPDSVKRAKEIIQKLDKVTPQVMIEAKVVEINTDFTNEIGIDWSADIGPWNSPERISGNLSGDVAMNLPVASAGTIGLAFTKVNGTPFVLNAQLTAMETRGKGKIISSPKVLTLDGKTAMIKHGFQYPYFEISDGDISVRFKDIVLSLEVTPMVTPDERVLLQIHVTKDDVGDFVSGSGFDVPSIIKNEAETELLVNDQDTIVIGGIVKTNKTSSTSGWPGLQNIPLLGWLFKKEGKSEISEELLIFITPKIVQLEQRHMVD
ncbi:MAG: type IV pilus secretin PilQ [Thermodesulfobacteriota bacterium]|nr:type IV pilus secretin PilQ [Thermodesulfobacteriota bacterium]